MMPILRTPTVARLGVGRVFQARAFSASATNMKLGLKAQKKLEEEGLPVPPKAPGTPYTYFAKHFFRDQRDEAMGPDGKLSIEKAGERIGALWKDMPSSEKSAYEKEAESAKATYLQEFTSWSGSLKAGQLQKIEKIVGQKIRAPGGRKKTLGGHHPPQSAYTLWYIESLRNGKIVAEDSAVTATEKVASTGRQAGAMWKSMSDEEKQPYKERYQQAKADYERAKQ